MKKSLFCVLLFIFCGAVNGGTPGPDEEKKAGREPETVWKYLQAKYDADKDGRITYEEYGRGRELFGRLDRDDDEAITENDFTPRARKRAGRAAMRIRMSIMTIGRYLQADENREDLTQEELMKSLALYDRNKDSIVSREEFDRESRTRGAVPRPDMNRYTNLLETMDKNKDGCLQCDEVVTFFRDQDSNCDGVWTLEETRTRSRGRGGAAGSDAAKDDSPSAVGKRAPDFELESLEDGTQVKLSSYAGQKPVALIFGSYT